jgi:hypothetical protein
VDELCDLKNNEAILRGSKEIRVISQTAKVNATDKMAEAD